MAIGVLALVGTRKGLFLLRGDGPACPLADAREILVIAILSGG